MKLENKRTKNKSAGFKNSRNPLKIKNIIKIKEEKAYALFYLYFYYIFIYWAGSDLNQRRHCQRIYNPPPLTARAPTQYYWLK